MQGQISARDADTLPVVSSGLIPSGRTVLNALHYKQDSEWVTITHPYHPLKGKSFKILLTRKVGGKTIVSLEKEGLGSFAVLQEWTNQSNELNQIPQIHSFFCILELISLISDKKGVTNDL